MACKTSPFFLAHSPLVEELTAGRQLLPVQRAASLVLGDPGLKEVTLFLHVDHLAHPREGIFFLGEHRIQANLLGPAIGDKA